jgi:hypothetical protein
MRGTFLAVLTMMIATCNLYAQNHIVNNSKASASSAINLMNAPFWSTERSATPGYYSAIAPEGAYVNGSDSHHINGYVSHEPGSTGQGFVFPVGDGIDLRQVITNGFIADNIVYATAWIKGNPSLTVDPTDSFPGLHDLLLKEPIILEVSKIGQWDWVEIIGSTAGMTVAVSIPEIPPAFSTHENLLRLVGWDGTQWVNLGTSGANGLSENSLLTGTITSGITALGIGRVCEKPTITVQPASNLYCFESTPLQLSIEAEGKDLTYQWYSNTNNSNFGGTPMVGETDAVFSPSTSTADTFYYYVEVASEGVCRVASDIAAIIVKNLPPTSPIFIH